MFGTKSRKIFALLFILALVFSLGGGAVLAADKVTIRFAHTWTGSDIKAAVFAELLDKFRKEHPDIKIVEEAASGDELRTKIKVDLASNNLPDVFTYWGGGILKPLADYNKVLNVDEYLELSKTLNKEDISDAAWQFYTFNNKTYGIPVEGFISAFIVNKEMFKKYGLEYPKTQEDLLKVAKVFNENGIVPLAVGSKGGNPSHFYFSELYNQLPNGTEEIENIASTHKFVTENALEVAKAINEQRLAGVFPEDTIANGDWSPSFELYNNGRAAMVYTYPWMLGLMDKELVKKSEVVPLPKIDGAAKDPSNIIQSSAVFGFVINRDSFYNSAKQKAMVTFLDFLTSKEMFQKLGDTGMVPTRDVSLNMDNINPMMRKVYNYSEGLEKVPAHFNTILDNKAFVDLQNSLDELFAGILTAEEFVNKVQKTFDKIK